MRILVVDDDANVLRSLCALLRQGGFETVSANTGRETLDAAEESDEIDLVLLDVMLPDMSGLDVCKRLKQNQDHFIPVILVTAQDTRENRINGLESGADDYVVKPFDNRELMARVKALLRIKTLHDKVRTLASVREQIVYTVSHDFRTPLVGIRGAIQNLVNGLVGEVSPEQKEYLDLVDQATRRLSSMTDQMCKMARRVETDPTPGEDTVDLRRAADTALSGLRPEIVKRGLRVEIDSGEDVPPALGESESLVQVLANLLDNAVKHAPNGSHIRVQIRPESGVRGPKVHVVVKDEGPGVARSDFERIFYRFEQVGDPDLTANMGTGMGLAICKEIVETFDGSIWVESEPGSGASFHFVLPGVTPAGVEV